MTAFGCNFEGEIPVDDVVAMVRTDPRRSPRSSKPGHRASTWPTRSGTPLRRPSSASSDACRERVARSSLGLHLHDTRGLGVANAWAAMRLGVDHFDSTCAGLGGCPFAGHAARPATCARRARVPLQEAGIETGVDLDAMIECARLAESIVGHPLPGQADPRRRPAPRRRRAGAAVDNGCPFVKMPDAQDASRCSDAGSDLSPEEFDQHWRESHPQYVRRCRRPPLRAVPRRCATSVRGRTTGCRRCGSTPCATSRSRSPHRPPMPMREDETRFVDTIDWFIVDEDAIREIELPASRRLPSRGGRRLTARRVRELRPGRPWR